MMPLLTGIHNIERSTFLQEALFHSLFSKSPPLFRTTLESRSAQTAQSCKNPSLFREFNVAEETAFQGVYTCSKRDAPEPGLSRPRARIRTSVSALRTTREGASWPPRGLSSERRPLGTPARPPRRGGARLQGLGQRRDEARRRRQALTLNKPNPSSPS